MWKFAVINKLSVAQNHLLKEIGRSQDDGVRGVLINTLRKEQGGYFGSAKNLIKQINLARCLPSFP